MRPSVLSVLHASMVRASVVPVALLPAVALL
ncbi:MAG: hypothetical protein K0R62_7708, partial [Nonomuraea muscovyensis]|nr:hypothetical protein [Nonomuraea muscovyensis]